MKKALLLAAFFAAFVTQGLAQVQDIPSLVGKATISQSGSGAGYWQVDGNFTDESGYYTSSDLQVGDVLFFSDAGIGYHLPITSVISATPPSFRVRVNNTGITGVLAVPTGAGAFYRPSSIAIGPYTSGLTGADQQTLNNYMTQLISAGSGGGGGPDSTWQIVGGGFTGKRPSTGISRTGTVSARTTDTLGVLTLGNRVGEKPAIYTQNTITPAGYRVYNRVQNPANQWQSFPDWDWYDGTINSPNNSSTFPGLVDPKPNVVWRRGLYYNKGTATMYESDESNWWANSILGESGAPFSYFEKHWQVIDSGGYEHRPITGFFQKRANGKGSIGLNVDLLYVDDWYNRQNAFFEVNHNSEPRRANTNLFNDSLYTVNYGNLYPTMAAWFASANKFSGVSTGKGTFIGIGGNGQNANFAGIGAVYVNDNMANGDLDMVFTTAVSAAQTEQMRIKGGVRKIGFFTDNPQQSVDVNGTALVRGSVRINSVADSATLNLKMANAQAAPVVRIQANNGVDVAEIRVANPTSAPSLVVGYAGIIASNCPTNTVVGITGANLTTAGGGNSVLVGFSTGENTYNGYQNVHIGSFAGQTTTDGFQNTLIGHEAGRSITTGYQNMFLGRQSGRGITSGQNNVGLGANALRQIGTGSGNIAIGGQAGDQNINGNENVFIGLASGRTTQGSGNVFLGTSVGELAASVSNQFWVDNSNTSTPLLKGSFTSDTLRVFGRLAAGFESQAQTSSVLDLVTAGGRSKIFRTNATPESAVTANPGDIALSNLSGVGVFYGKYSGTGNTGWGKFLNLIDPLSASTGQYLAWNGTTWAPTTLSTSVTRAGVFTTTPNSKGLVVSGDSIQLAAASVTNPGAVSTTTQTFGGAKIIQVNGSSPTTPLTLSNNSDPSGGVDFPIVLGGTQYFRVDARDSASGGSNPLTTIYQRNAAGLMVPMIRLNGRQGIEFANSIAMRRISQSTGTRMTLTGLKSIANAYGSVDTIVLPKIIGTSYPASGEVVLGTNLWVSNLTLGKVIYLTASGDVIDDGGVTRFVSPANESIHFVASNTGQWTMRRTGGPAMEALTATTIDYDGATPLYIGTTATTTTVNLPEIVTSNPGANQVLVGTEIDITINNTASVTIARRGSDVIWRDGDTASGTSLVTTGGTFFTKKLRAVAPLTWAVK